MENGYGLPVFHGHDADAEEVRRKRVLPRINTRPSKPMLVFFGRLENLELSGACMRRPRSLRG